MTAESFRINLVFKSANMLKVLVLLTLFVAARKFWYLCKVARAPYWFLDVIYEKMVLEFLRSKFYFNTLV